MLSPFHRHRRHRRPHKGSQVLLPTERVVSLQLDSYSPPVGGSFPPDVGVDRPHRVDNRNSIHYGFVHYNRRKRYYASIYRRVDNRVSG